MQRRQFLGLTLSAAGALALSGCGFHLRGLEEGGILTLEQLAVAGNEGPFADMLVQRLEDYGVQVRDDAPLRLNLSTENASYRQLSTLDSGTQDGQLVLNVPYSIPTHFRQCLSAGSAKCRGRGRLLPSQRQPAVSG